MQALTALDSLIVCLYLTLVLAVGFRKRGQKTAEQYFVANRRIPGWVVAFSIMGTVISSVSFIALPGAAFAQGWRLIVANLMVPVVLVFVTLFVVPLYRRVVRMSSYEYLERRFGIGARLYGSFGFLLLRTVDLGFTLLLTAVAVEGITGWEIRWSILLIAVVTLTYTLLGGMEAVVWNDVPQGLILFGGAATLLYLVLWGSAASPSEIVSRAWDGGRFSLGDFTLSWESLFAERPTVWLLMLSGLAHFGRSYITEQNMVQRYLVARTDREARQATAAGAALCLAVWLGFTFIGSCLWAYYQLPGHFLPPEVAAKPDNVVPHFIATQFPHGLLGLVLAAILAAAMQAFSADLTSVATVATQDYYGRFRESATERDRLRFGRAAVLVAGLAATGVALQLAMTRAQAIYEAVISFGMILSGGMLGLFALGFLTRRATRRGAYAGIAACILFVAWATLTGPLKLALGPRFSMHPIMIGVLSHPILFIVGYLASRLDGEAPPQLQGLTIYAGSGATSRR